MGSVKHSRQAATVVDHPGFPASARSGVSTCRAGAVVSSPLIPPSGKLLVALAIHLALSGSQAAAGDTVVALSPLQFMPLSRFVDATSLELLADMVVTDTKVAQAPDSVTQAMVVLRSDDLERQPVYNRNLAELMRYTSGQFVNVLSRNQANWGAYAGLGSKYNTWLLDGLPIDSFVDPMSLDAFAIERIEVQKGPASVLYSNYLTMDFAGNETPLAGTTNLVLKNRIDTPLTRFSVGAGSWNTWAGRAYTQGRHGGLSYIAGAGVDQSDYTQAGSTNSWLQTTEHPDYQKARLYGNLNCELGRPNHSISLFLHHTAHDGTEGRPNRDFQHRYDTLNFTYSNQINDVWNVQIKAGERRYDRQWDNDKYTSTPSSLAFDSHETVRQTLRPLDLTLSYLHSRNNLFTLGVDNQTASYEYLVRPAAGVDTVTNDMRASSTGVFAQEKMQWQDWVFRAGLRHNTIRHDYTSLGGGIPSTSSASWGKALWSLGARYNATPDLALYTNTGTSFLTPSAKQVGGTNGQLPNPGLQPETGLASDLGLEWRVSSSVNLGLRTFVNTIDNAIVENAQPGGSTKSENASQMQSKGIELDVRHTPTHSFVWFANLAYTHTRVTNKADPDQDGTNISFAPDLVANAGATASVGGGWTVSPYLHWVGRYYDSTSQTGRHPFGKYGVLNLRVQKNLRPGTEFTLDLSNLGNRRYEMPWGFQDPGFHAFASLNFTL